ncbi:MAG: hypothetical protein ACLQNE_07995 [Thermoguttaceae bacterium]
MDVPEEERREANRIGALIRKKLFEIMDLQAHIDALLRDEHPTPFGSARFKNSRPETLQRVVAMTAIQFILFEPAHLVQGNEEVHAVGKKMIDLIVEQLRGLPETEPKGQRSHMEREASAPPHLILRHHAVD